MLPVFIVGMMRSGSTLTETMLDAHKEIYGIGEDSVFNGNLSSLRDGLVRVADDQDIEKIRHVVRTFGKQIASKNVRNSEE